MLLMETVAFTASKQNEVLTFHARLMKEEKEEREGGDDDNSRQNVSPLTSNRVEWLFSVVASGECDLNFSGLMVLKAGKGGMA